MFKKLLLTGLLSVCMLAMSAPESKAYYWYGFSGYPGSTILEGTICGARGTNQWWSWARVDATITGVNCYCRNKPQNSFNAKAAKFIGTDYDVSAALSIPDASQDTNGCYTVYFEITDQMARDAAGDVGFVCPNDNWHLMCQVAEVESYWEIWYGRNGECTTGDDYSGLCTVDDTCNVEFFDPDPKTGIYQVTADCLADNE